MLDATRARQNHQSLHRLSKSAMQKWPCQEDSVTSDDVSLDCQELAKFIQFLNVLEPLQNILFHQRQAEPATQICSRQSIFGSTWSVQTITVCPAVCEQKPCRVRETTQKITKQGNFP